VSVVPLSAAAPVPSPDPLTDALHAHFAVMRLSRLGLAYTYASTLPALGLLAHARRPLPGLVVWFSGLAWSACCVLAVSLGVLARRWSFRLAKARAGARDLARLEAPSQGTPRASSVFAALSLAAAGVLWIHGMAPGWPPAPTVTFAASAWAMLTVLALCVSCFER
jgi:hypothetical protein